ncbi:MAG: ATP-binding protein [Candidatus Aenigmarchaeota archaeon]|nr:ATP-binding protein [Candidatus Aenigmarchaeota archaeon]
MYIEREIKDKFKKVANVYSVVTLVGARQAGKTTFLKEQIKQLNSSYLLFDDPDIRELFEEDIKKFEKQNIEGHDISVLDEVQYCNDAGKKLKYLADVGRKIWITSSSEIVLSRDVLSYLVGRVSIIRLYPFSIQEFLNLKDQKELTPQILERVVWEHATFGGYPKVTLVEDIELKKTILKDLYDTMILKDIARVFSIEDLKSLENFVKYLSLNIGGLISYENISKDIKLSFQSLKKYLDAMEKSYLIARVLPFYTNKIKEITKQPKIYFIDTGLRNAISKNFGSAVDGKVFENYVFSELMKSGFYPKYWRTKSKAEVDFVIEKENEIIPIEVKLNNAMFTIERSLRSFIDTYKPKQALVVYYSGKGGTITINGCKISFVNILEMRKILRIA